jgi:hypothetical protein
VGGVADFNRDGRVDILWRDASTQRNSLWLMNGTASSANLTLPTASSAWQMQGTGDFNGDGDPDVLWRNPSTGQNSIWLMNQTSVASTVALPPVTGSDWRMASTFPMTIAAPTHLALAPASNTGSTNDSITSIATPLITGQAIPGTWVKLYANGQLLGTSRTGSSGTWQIQATTLAPGNHSLTATSTRPEGLVSPVSAPLSLTIVPPISLSLANDTGSGATYSADRITSDPTMTGQVDRASATTVTMQVGSGGTATAVDITNRLDATGNFSLNRAALEQLSGQVLGDGSHVGWASPTFILGIKPEPIAPTKPNLHTRSLSWMVGLSTAIYDATPAPHSPSVAKAGSGRWA